MQPRGTLMQKTMNQQAASCGPGAQLQHEFWKQA
jgi:hypothetical protein